MRPEEFTYLGRDGAFSEGVCASAAELADDSGQQLGGEEQPHQTVSPHVQGYRRLLALSHAQIVYHAGKHGGRSKPGSSGVYTTC